MILIGSIPDIEFRNGSGYRTDFCLILKVRNDCLRRAVIGHNAVRCQNQILNVDLSTIYYRSVKLHGIAVDLSRHNFIQIEGSVTVLLLGSVVKHTTECACIF